MKDGIKAKTLEALADAGAIRKAWVVADQKHWVIVVQVGTKDKKLEAQRGHIRQFVVLETALALLQSIGILQVEVDLTTWDRHGP